jgi:uncharacterized protein (TIGR02145 family)
MMKRIFVYIFISAWLFSGCKKSMVYNPAVTPAVVTSYPVNVTAKSAELAGVALNGGGDISARGFYWMIKSSAMYDDNGELNMTKVDSLIMHSGTKVEAPAEGAFKTLIEGLIKDTVYFVKAYAGNSKGITYGESVSFRTAKLVPPSVKMGQEYTTIGDSIAIVTGEVTAVGGDVVTERGLIWGTNEDPTKNTQKIIAGSGQGSFTDTIPHLEQFVKYYITAYAVNAYGISYSAPLIILFMPPTFTDPRDGQVYTVKQYGGTVWMTQNFRYIPAVGNAAGIWVQGYTGTNVEEAKATQAYKTYGCLYNLQQAIDLAPPGWHLATDEEWNKLEILCSGGALDSASAHVLGWIESVNSGRLKAWGGAGDDMEFNLLPGGNQWCGGAFQDFEVWAHYWAAKEGHPYDSFFRRMLAGWDNGIYRDDSQHDGFPVCAGMSARYVKD